MIQAAFLIGCLLLAGCADKPAPSMLNVDSWCRGRSPTDVCMMQTYTETGGLVFTINRSIVHVPARIEWVDTIAPLE